MSNERAPANDAGFGGGAGSSSGGGAGSRSSGGFSARTLPNIVAVARRELVSRARTRAYRLTTVILVVAGTALALAPTIIAFFDQGGGGTRVEVVANDTGSTINFAGALQQILNASATGTAGIGVPGQQGATPKIVVVASDDVDAARGHVRDGSSAAALVITRSPTGDLAFQLYTKDGPLSRSAALARQASVSIAIQDRLTRAGIPPIDQAKLFATPAFDVQSPDPNARPTLESGEAASSFFIGFGLTIAIFMAIILYGQWIAYSVAEEKNSRVMEIVLAAATPFQLLAGKVIGVGALAIAQYVLVSIPVLLVVAFQGQIAGAILGGPVSTADLPPGLTLPLILTFGVMFVLGFAIYACLYAGAASLVSRQEDINQIVAPLTIVSVIGYLVATYAGTGLIPIDSPLVVILSYIPLFSPYLMITRYGQGAAAPIEVVIAVILLLITIPLALWLAARLYRSGVLMYGQPPTPRTLWKALRAG